MRFFKEEKDNSNNDTSIKTCKECGTSTKDKESICEDCIKNRLLKILCKQD